jgi:hypothetical protein
MDVSRIYFDASTLIANGWPAPSPQLLRLLKIAMLLPKVEVFIPELVELECEAEWLRRFDDRKREVISKIDALATHSQAFKKPHIELPTVPEGLAQYRETVTALKASLEIQRSPTTQRSVYELLSMSILHVSPFATSDRSFRDSVIVVSIIDHLSAAKEPIRAMLVTNDAFFDNKGQTTESGSILDVVVKDLPVVDKTLRSMVEREWLTAWLADTELATAALEKDKERIAQFLTENLSIPAGGFFRPKIKAIRGLTLNTITDFVTSNQNPASRAEDVIEQVSFNVAITLHETVEIYPLPEARQLSFRVGEEVTETPAAGLFPPPTAQDVDVEAEVSVQAEAHIVKGDYREFKYVSATLAQPKHPSVEALKRARQKASH